MGDTDAYRGKAGKTTLGSDTGRASAEGWAESGAVQSGTGRDTAENRAEPETVKRGSACDVVEGNTEHAGTGEGPECSGENAGGDRQEYVIEMEHLTKRYGKKVAVNDLTLSIRRGEVFGLLGPNGAGKTTTILMLLGLTEPSGGMAKIEGMDCTRDPLGVKSIVGYLPDNAGFYGDMTGRQNLRFTGRLNGLEGQELEDRIEMLLKRVDIAYAGDQKVGTYSKGMRQRLGVADVLMKDPEIIIMDEPTLGIDPEGMRKLLILIRELAVEDGRTILISSHQLQQIQQICDRVGIFIEGSLIVEGTLRELEEHIRKEGSYLLELTVQPLDDQLLGMLYQQEGVRKIEKEGDKFMITSKIDIRPQLTRFLGEHGYTVYHLHQRGGDLDEIYRVYFEKAGQADERSNYEKNNRKRQRRRKSRDVTGTEEDGSGR